VALSFLSSLRKLAHFIAFGDNTTLCPIYLGEIRRLKVRHPGPQWSQREAPPSGFDLS
jgi:hypothetical protein